MPYSLTIGDLDVARTVLEENEPRDLFYRAATELVSLALRNETSLSLAESLAVLLQTWNRPFYQYHPFDKQHFHDIENLIRNHQDLLMAVRSRSIVSILLDDEPTIQQMFQDFEGVLGPVGAAKSLHLLAPQFFPLWDRKIAASYGLPLGPVGTNFQRYNSFMKIVIEQIRSLGGMQVIARNLLKAIDEYNYCKYTKKWVASSRME